MNTETLRHSIMSIVYLKTKLSSYSLCSRFLIFLILKLYTLSQYANSTLKQNPTPTPHTHTHASTHTNHHPTKSNNNKINKQTNKKNPTERNKRYCLLILPREYLETVCRCSLLGLLHVGHKTFYAAVCTSLQSSMVYWGLCLHYAVQRLFGDTTQLHVGSYIKELY